MGDYTNMSAYYDLIMTSGYYDYQKIVENITRDSSFGSVLEIGCGTGLILEELGQRQPDAEIMGVDLTEAMLSIVSDRLQQFPNISLSLENVTDFDLKKRYDLAFSLLAASGTSLSMATRNPFSSVICRRKKTIIRDWRA
jgi:Trans-aconitate methyltransferase